jgi:hypothetical protein
VHRPHEARGSHGDDGRHDADRAVVVAVGCVTRLDQRVPRQRRRRSRRLRHDDAVRGHRPPVRDHSCLHGRRRRQPRPALGGREDERLDSPLPGTTSAPARVASASSATATAATPAAAATPASSATATSAAAAATPTAAATTSAAATPTAAAAASAAAVRSLATGPGHDLAVADHGARRRVRGRPDVRRRPLRCA